MKQGLRSSLSLHEKVSVILLQFAILLLFFSSGSYANILNDNKDAGNSASRPVDFSMLEVNFQREIHGRVLNEQGNPLANVSVMVVGTQTGTTTNDNGEFRLNASGDDVVLEVSSIGYRTNRVNIGSQRDVTITMEVEAAGLSEVIVTSLGIKRETKSLVYATQTVEPKEMIDIKDPNNLLNSFQGKIANAVITQSVGGVGSDASIILRGNRSIQGSNNALIVIDGVPSNTSTPRVNPNDIESVTVLRGASAGALYGSQAGNGVIVITTKTGSARDGVDINVNSGFILNKVYGLPPLQNSYGQGSNGVLDAFSGSSWGPKLDGQSYTDFKGNQSSFTAQPDNVKDFFNSGMNFNNSISVSGGSEKVKGYLSYENNSIRGIVPTNNLMNHDVNLKGTMKLNDRISVEGNLNFFTEKVESEYNTFSGPVLRLLQIPRNVPLAYAKDYEEIDASGVPVPKFWSSPDKVTYQNPYWIINRHTNPKNQDQLRGYLRATYKITDWLSVRGDLNLSKGYVFQERKVWENTYYNPSKVGGTYIQTNGKTQQKWYDVIFEGHNNISSKIKANYQFGAIYKDNIIGTEVLTASGLNVPNQFSLNFATTPIMNQSATEIQTQSLFGQLNLSYNDAVFLDGSIRNDWSSLLPAPHSFQYYSAGISAVWSSIFDLPDGINFLKSSLNYAEVGNGGQFGLLTSIYKYVPGPGKGYLMRSDVVPFPELKPEIVQNVEFNTEARLLKNRLHFEFTYYNSNSKNQLLSIQIPPATGYASRYINAGNIRNRGIELTMGGVPVRSTDFDWDIALNFSLNRSKVIRLADNLETVYLGFFSSNTITTQISEGGAYGDIFSSYWMKNDKGEYLVTPAGLPMISDKEGLPVKKLGNFMPNELLSMTNTLNYKDFSLRFLVDGRIGGIVVTQVDLDLEFDGGPDFTEKYREGGWNLGGVDPDGNKVSATVTSQQFWQWVSSKRYGVGEFAAYDATNFRMREIALGYNIPVKTGFFLKAARVSFVARNLFFLYRGSTILDVPGLGKRKMWFDPDITGGGVQNQFNYIPPTRNYGINLNITF